MANNNFKDPFDEWQYWIFRLVLFILFLITAFKLLDHDLHISSVWSSIISKASSSDSLLSLTLFCANLLLFLILEIKKLTRIRDSKIKDEKKAQIIYRRSDNGRFCTKTYAKKHPKKVERMVIRVKRVF